MPFDCTLSGWQAFQDLQHFISTRNLASHALACEEALSNVLDEFKPNVAPSAADVNRRFRSLRRNRVRKHRRRQALVAASAKVPDGAPRPRLDHLDDLRYVKSLTTDDEWRLIQGVANMSDYASLAAGNGLSVGQLRTRISRLRARVQAAA